MTHLAIEKGGPNQPITLATLSFSDTRTSGDDRSGAALRRLLEEGGITLGPHRIVREEPGLMKSAVLDLIDNKEIDGLVTTGGTGVAARDHTLSVLEALFDKPLYGFGETFRRLSIQQIGPRGMLSNATAGTVRGKVIFALPGSIGAVSMGTRDLLLPVVGHIVALLRGETAHGPPSGASHG